MFVLLFGLFSFTVNAESSPKYHFYINDYFNGKIVSKIEGDAGDSILNSSIYNENWNNGEIIYLEFTISNADGSILLKKGKNYDFSLSNINAYFQDIDVFPTEVFFWESLTNLRFNTVNTDGSYSIYYDNIEYKYGSGSRTGNVVSGNITAEKDVKKIKITMGFSVKEKYGYTAYDSITFTYGATPCSFTLNVQSEEAGLLSGLIGWVQNIFSKINETFTELKNGFSNVINSLLELPAKLWQLISDGLKDLFVPDEQFMTEYSEEWDFLLGQRFGALYDVADIIRDFVGDIQYSDTTNTIYMPNVSLDSVGIPFSFGGYEVQIVPNGFDFIVEVLKKIISAICTFMFITSMRKRYDEIMGVEQ